MLSNNHVHYNNAHLFNKKKCSFMLIKIHFFNINYFKITWDFEITNTKANSYEIKCEVFSVL